MRKFLILLFFLVCLLGFGQASTKASYAQYCFPVANYCSGIQLCSGDTCSVSCSDCPGGCSGGACNPTYTISGNVYRDLNGNGFKDVGDNNYSGASVTVWGVNTITNGSGNYSRTLLPAGTNNVTLNVPIGFEVTTPPATRSITLGPSTVVNYGIRAVPPPVCVPGAISLNPSGGTANPGASVTLSVTSCTDVEDPDNNIAPPPFSWNPDTGGANPPPTLGTPNNTPTSSTVTWTAPVCPTNIPSTTYTPQVIVAGPGGTTAPQYTTSIIVPGTVQITAHVRDVSTVGSCSSSTDNAYTGGGTGATLNLTNGGTYYQNLTTSTSGPTAGQASFTCLIQGNYTLSLNVPSGYSVVGTDVTPASETLVGTNGLSFATSTNNQVATFCIAPLDSWFQTDFGDVRLLNLLNPVPSGLKGSTGGTDGYFPGIFFSSDSATRAFGNGSASTKGWFINGEYSYNADTENRNGGMSYDFYKSKANRDGVTITEIPEEDPIDLSDETQFPDVEGRIYEVGGAGSITSIGSSPITITGKRIVILAKGDVRIDQPIRVTAGNGLLIIAAKGDITIGEDVGTDTLTSTATQLDGYFTAQGSIIIESKTPDITEQCTATAVDDDLRLNVGGALVANSLKPFSSTGTGSIQRNRNLCLNNLLYPSLYISSRPDFLTQLTDFYKVSYSKWSEVNP